MAIWSVTLYKQKIFFDDDLKIYIYEARHIYEILSVNCEAGVWINAKLWPLDVRH